MKIYLVRHGESQGNVGNLMQNNDEPLTNKGKTQAESLAKKFNTIEINSILSSPSMRAKNTAEIINATINKPIEYTNLLIERQLPSDVLGQNKDNPALLELRQSVWDHSTVPGWKHSDEESFEDLKKRAFECLNLFLEAEKAGIENLLVVTHGFFMRVMLACAIMGEKVTAEEYQRIVMGFLTYNTGVATLLHTESFFEGTKPLRWMVLGWNDLSHLDTH